MQLSVPSGSSEHQGSVGVYSGSTAALDQGLPVLAGRRANFSMLLYDRIHRRENVKLLFLYIMFRIQVNF